MKIPFGKHKDSEIEDIPSSYLVWLEENTDSNSIWKENARQELNRRRELASRSSVSTKTQDARDETLGHLYRYIKRMDPVLLGRDLVLNKEFKIRIDKI